MRYNDLQCVYSISILYIHVAYLIYNVTIITVIIISNDNIITPAIAPTIAPLPLVAVSSAGHVLVPPVAPP